MSLDTNTEFGYELVLVIPYAYWLYTHGRLIRTVSAKHTRELYYFSPQHTEKYEKRTFSQPKVPNKELHVRELMYEMWKPPPYKLIYRNDIFNTFEKPLMIIHNKYNREWGGAPINYIDARTLDTVFAACVPYYQIVYIRPRLEVIIGDNSEVLTLEGETEVLEKYKGSVLDGNELFQVNKSACRNFNHFQLLLHACCERFISVQGGSSILASYFGGTNIIFARRGGELDCGSYEGFYRRLSGCDTIVAKDYATLIDAVRSLLLRPIPENAP
jgi:hypothetical protein